VDKAGSAPQLDNVIDPVTGVSVTFPDLTSPPFGGEDFQTNLTGPSQTPSNVARHGIQVLAVDHRIHKPILGRHSEGQGEKQ
jgi:hypothetical protein